MCSRRKGQSARHEEKRRKTTDEASNVGSVERAFLRIDRVNRLITVKHLVVCPGSDLESDGEGDLMRRLGDEKVLSDVGFDARLENLVHDGVPEGMLDDFADLLRGFTCQSGWGGKKEERKEEGGRQCEERRARYSRERERRGRREMLHTQHASKVRCVAGVELQKGRSIEGEKMGKWKEGRRR
jgi:hypothetical protein